MRISSLTIWLCSAFLVGANNVTFNTAYFEGFNSTAVLLYNETLLPGNSKDGYMFGWTPNQSNGGPAVKSLTLAEVDGPAIVTAKNDQPPDSFSGQSD